MQAITISGIKKTGFPGIFFAGTGYINAVKNLLVKIGLYGPR